MTCSMKDRKPERVIKINTPEWVGKVLVLLGLGQIEIDPKEILKKEAEEKNKASNS